MKTEVIHTTRKGTSILLVFHLILNDSVGSIYSHTNSYNNAITQCHVDGAQRAWATCDLRTPAKENERSENCLRFGTGWRSLCLYPLLP